MAKKSKKSIVKLIPLCLLAISVLVLVMGFLPGVIKSTDNSTSTVNLFRLAFGGRVDNLSISIGSIASNETVITFAILPVLCLLLPLIGSVVCFLVKGRVGGLVVCLTFLFAAVCFFLIPQVSFLKVTTSTIVGSGSSTSSFKDLGYALGIGSILGGAISIVGTLGSAFYLLKVK